MDLQAVQQFLEQSKDQEDVKSYLQGLSQVTPDGAKAFLETDEGKKLLQPQLDSYFTKGLDTWKKNNLEKLISEEVSKRNPQETPEQKQLRELQEKINQMEQEKTREALKNVALTQLSQKKLPANLVDLLIGKDQESTLANLTKYEEVFTSHLQSLVDEKLKSGGSIPKDGQPPQTFTKEQISSMSPDEINKHWDSIKNTKL
ncbi:DUF4355 domain-containing protein [Ammoniphilus resinae]|uniref:DUF4355 domain-containing protein n=1 Tax=Ammoniphilus resinae TaxID=861532 RepID=A0ABS4GXX4_9BACL|nr:DUF4355 domain-containing protein [Ammoniphilus resinae]MBP1935096.1 hypothetical protein [Ammoniphilus resinae]